MPDGIIARLIVRLNEYIEDGLIWKRGVILTKDNCQAQIIEEDNAEGLKIIDIHINGDIHQRKYLLHTIRQEIESIHHKWFKNIQSEAMIPCSCEECKNSKIPTYFEYSELKQYQAEDMREINCKNGKIKPVNVSLILEGVSIPKEKIERLGSRKGDTYIYGNQKIINGDEVMGNSIKANGNSGIINMGDHNTITQTITTTNSDLKELLEAFQAEANKVAESLPADKQAEFKGDAETFIEKAQEGKLDKYFNLSKEGLLEAAEAVGEVGVKLAKYIPQILKAL
jgi:hypothetical protein